MPSTQSSNLDMELMATGENDGTWGIKTNSNLGIIDNMAGGRLSLSVAGSSNVTLTDGQAQNVRMTFTGILTGNIDVLFPTRGRFYIVTNSTTGAFDLNIKYDGGSGFVLPQGATAFVFNNPSTTTMEAALSYLSTVLGATLTISGNGTIGGTFGVTGATTLSSTLAVTGNTTLTGTLTANADTILANTGPTSTTSAGYRGAPGNTQNSGYTLVLADAGKTIYHNNASTHAWTIPPNSSVAFPLNTIIVFTTILGSVTVTRGSGVTLYWANGSAASSANRTLAAVGTAAIQKVDTDTWVISGSGLS